MNLYKKALILIIILIATTGCATRVVVNPASPEQQQTAQSFTVKPGMAKVYFVGGKMGNAPFKVSIPEGATFFVDGNMIGQIDKNDVLVMDVTPKQYNFSWQYPAGDSKVIFLNKSLLPGDVLILQADWNTGGAAFGLIGLALNPAKYEITEVFDRSLISGKRFVSPIKCPSSICE